MSVSVIPYIPEFITVHLGQPSQQAENVTVTFPDYIKNVASSEVYPTWKEEALKANILAQISFALNRVYTEFYPSRGYDFDITSETQNDQKFIKGRSTFENIDRLVDDMFTTYIRRVGFVEPLAAKFCNGTTSTCDGLSQWGSEALAQEGEDYMSILRRYYGNDIELVNDAPIRDVPNSYPGYPLRQGTTGEDVVVLQAMLNRIGQNYPAIPRLTQVDGIFGPKTEEAVRVFQSVFGLSVDGIVGRATWYKLVFLYVAVTKLSELVSEGQSFTQVQGPSGIQVLRQGDRGPAVSALQFFLSLIGQYSFTLPMLDIDGIFGPKTRQAVEQAQKNFGLPVTGVVNNATWLNIYDEYKGIATTSLADANLPLSPSEIENQFQAGQFPGYSLTYGTND
ncbi:peptidoglycan-binding protein [Pseudoflavonifractor sp. An85]|uniref:peptidoglycan-binding protein n=1 Tax=Pseudoflavonifractor sp. An85 TaxID=1965661 RepID=UPI000B39BBF2|nr:peptidoglycan-binding protein [Pseudoflavonifractor sp. An85]OUN25046.1 spore cortex-lytic protein [Pseudoflavonifractor sp. An85]